MKPLLTKITRPFIIYVLVVLVVSIPVYYLVVDNIWKSELDEHNKIVAKETEFELNQLNLSDEKLQSSIQLWNEIHPGTNILVLAPDENLKDSSYTQNRFKIYSKKKKVDRFRILSTVIHLNHQPYRFVVRTNIEESKETITALAYTTIVFILLLLIGLLILTRKISNKVWEPFRGTLKKLRAFNLNSQNRIELEKTNTREFEELNESLNKLIEHNVSAFRTQKEFTENASHELQTPLAILKNKLDILLQNKDLTEEQYQIVEDMNQALSRSARLNKSLLLLAKIDNRQFENSDAIDVMNLVEDKLQSMSDYFQNKKIRIQQDLISHPAIRGNLNLTEILINNLLLNAIQHTPVGGEFHISLKNATLTTSNSGDREIPQNSLFKRFSGSGNQRKGNGLGLAIIHEVCRFHSWNISYHFANNMHSFSVCFSNSGLIRDKT